MVDLLQVIDNVVAALGPFMFLISVLCFIFGITMIAMALMIAGRLPQTSGVGPSFRGGWVYVIMLMVSGAFFMAFPALIDALRVTFFGLGVNNNPSAIFSYAPATIGIMSGPEATRLVTGIVAIVQVIGLIAVMRGIFLLNASAKGAGGPPTYGPGLTFIIAGAMAVNFPVFVGVIEDLITAAPSP